MREGEGATVGEAAAVAEDASELLLLPLGALVGVPAEALGVVLWAALGEVAPVAEAEPQAPLLPEGAPDTVVAAVATPLPVVDVLGVSL